MKKVFSTTLEEETIKTLKDLSYFEDKDKNEIIDEAVKLYKEAKEKKDLEATTPEKEKSKK